MVPRFCHLQLSLVLSKHFLCVIFLDFICSNLFSPVNTMIFFCVSEMSSLFNTIDVVLQRMVLLAMVSLQPGKLQETSYSYLVLNDKAENQQS